MSTSSSCRMSIGGKIRRSDIPKLAEAIENDDAGLDWGDMGGIEADQAVAEMEQVSASRKPLVLVGDEVPWGQFEDVQNICRTLGLTYCTEYGGGGADYTPGMVLYDPALIQANHDYFGGQLDGTWEWATSDIGEPPMMPSYDIRHHLLAYTLESALMLMERAWNFPMVLEIIEDVCEPLAA